MSSNLVELIRRHHGPVARTALEVLKEAIEDHGEITDADRLRAAEVSGLPVASVYGVSTFYDDLLAPRGRRHLRVCTGTACFAADGDEHIRELTGGLGVALGERSADGSCLAGGDRVPRLLSLLTGGSRGRPCRCRRRGRGAGTDREHARGPRARVAEHARGTGADRARTMAGARPGRSRRSHPQSCSRRCSPARCAVAAAPPSRPARSGASRASAAGEQKFVVANGDEGDPGSYIDKYLMERNPALVLEGMALAGYAVGADHGFILTRSEYPRSKPALERAVRVRPRRRAARATTSPAAASTST